MDISVRLAAQTDATVISNLSGQLGYNVPEAETMHYLDTINKSNIDVVYVAEIDGIVIGWIQVSYLTRLESGFFCEIVGLVVDEQHRGKGTGKMFIDKAKEWCKGRGCKRLKVRSNVKRQETHLFYLNTGFSEVKEQKVFEMAL